MMRLCDTVLRVLTVILLSLCTLGLAPAREPDSLALYGTWQWIDSANEFSGFRGAPESCGCERLLTFERAGTYEVVEQDSAHEYVLCSGRYTVNYHLGRDPMTGRFRTLWASLENWCLDLTENQMISLVGFGSDTILVQGGPGVEDASSHHFARVTTPTASGSGERRKARLPLRDRPPRYEALRLPSDTDSVPYDEGPVAINRVDPVYSVYAREARLQGDVLLHVLVGRDGRVKNIKVIRGMTGLNDLAVDAVKKWFFKPALRNSRPVAVWLRIPFQFRL